MKPGIREHCSEQESIQLFGSRPSRNAIHMASTYICDSPEQADRRLAGEESGYAYQRDGQPNADALAEKCRKLHQADHAVVTSSGMSAISLALVAHVQSGDHVVLSSRLFGRTPALLQRELSRFGVTSSVVDMEDLEAVSASPSNTTMLIVETISNPNLHVVDLNALSKIAMELGAALLVDNTFASPIVCQPFQQGADFVVESLTKIMNGHGDVTMGLLCGTSAVWERVESSLTTWGMTTTPFQCWLAERGLGSLYLRAVAASQNARKIAEHFTSSPHPNLRSVRYPGLPAHEAFSTAESQFESAGGEKLFGNMLGLHLAGGWDEATRFIANCQKIDFCPSLGELSTTLSHPASTSHRSFDEDQLENLGFSAGLIRLSVGLEHDEFIVKAIEQALVGMDS